MQSLLNWRTRKAPFGNWATRAPWRREKDAILLAEEIGADLLIIDERAGYLLATNFRIRRDIVETH